MASIGTMRIKLYQVLVAHGGFEAGAMRAYPEGSVVAAQGVRRGLLAAAAGPFWLDVDAQADEGKLTLKAKKPKRVRDMKTVEELADGPAAI